MRDVMRNDLPQSNPRPPLFVNISPFYNDTSAKRGRQGRGGGGEGGDGGEKEGG